MTMLQLFSGKRSREIEGEAWVVLLGTTPDDDSLTVAAVTGTRSEAVALLEMGYRAFPERSNEFNSCKYTARPATRRGAPPPLPRIAPGEQRPVYVLSTKDWVEVFESMEDAEQEHRRAVAAGDHDPQLVEAVTNTWVGAVGTDPRLNRLS